MRRNDDALSDYFGEEVGDSVGSVFTASAKPDKITLDDRIDARQRIQAAVKNLRDISRMVGINVLVSFVDLDFNFVEHTFGANEEVSSGRIGPPDNSGSPLS